MRSKSLFGIVSSIFCLMVLSCFTPQSASAEPLCEDFFTPDSILTLRIQKIRATNDHGTNFGNTMAINDILKAMQDAGKWGRDLILELANDLATITYNDLSMSHLLGEDELIIQTKAARSASNDFLYQKLLKDIYDQVEKYRTGIYSKLHYEIRYERISALLDANDKVYGLYGVNGFEHQKLIQDTMLSVSANVKFLVDKAVANKERPKEAHPFSVEQKAALKQIDELRESFLPEGVKDPRIRVILKSMNISKTIDAVDIEHIKADLFYPHYEGVKAEDILRDYLLMKDIVFAAARARLNPVTPVPGTNVIDASSRVNGKQESTEKFHEIYERIDYYRKLFMETNQVAMTAKIDSLLALDMRIIRKDIHDTEAATRLIQKLLIALADPENANRPAQEIADPIITKFLRKDNP